MKYPSLSSKIFVAGHGGLVGSAIVRALEREGFEDLILRRREELDLLDQRAVDRFFAEMRPEFVYLAAAKVGGIQANALYPVDFLYENLAIETHLIKSAAEHGVEKLVFLGSSCIYPKHASQPISEDALLTGPLEPTNEAYAIAKIAGLKLCEAYHRQHQKRFVSVMPTNLYGPGDNFHPDHSHVVPGLMRRFHEAKVRGASQVAVWGSGRPKREFLHVDDLADALLVIMDNYEALKPINIGTGVDCSIAELAELLKEIIGFSGTVQFDPEMPDGSPQKLLDVRRLRDLGWAPRIPLRSGLDETYAWAVREGVFD